MTGTKQKTLIINWSFISNWASNLYLMRSVSHLFTVGFSSDTEKHNQQHKEELLQRFNQFDTKVKVYLILKQGVAVIHSVMVSFECTFYTVALYPQFGEDTENRWRIIKAKKPT